VRIAVMLDLDNFKPDLQVVQDALRRHGSLAIRRAFATDPKVRWFYGDKLREHGYRLEIAPSDSLRFQEVDRVLIESALELHSHFDALALGSHDQDYVPMLQRLASLGKRIIVFGDFVPRRLRHVANVSFALGPGHSDPEGPRTGEARGLLHASSTELCCGPAPRTGGTTGRWRGLSPRPSSRKPVRAVTPPRW